MAGRVRNLPDKVDGPLWERATSFEVDLAEQGYAQNTIHSQLWLVARLSRWMAKEGLSLSQLTPAALQRFEKHRWERGGVRRKCSLVPIVRYLRRLGQIPELSEPLTVGPVEELIKRYREYLVVERGAARATVVKYEHVARLFLSQQLTARGAVIETLGGAAVTEFIAQECRNCGIGAAKNRVKGLRSLLRFLHQEGLTGALVAAVPTVSGWRDAHLPRGLEPERVTRLLDSCDISTVVGRRDRAVLMLLARMGLRAGEVAALELGHFDWSRGEVVIPGKGQRQERLPLPADVGEALVAYIMGGRPKYTSGRLFLRVQAPQGSIGVESVKEIVRRACRRAGIPSLGPHCLRHTAASQALAAGASLIEVGQMLRHRDLSTTAIYAKVDRTRLRDLARPWPGGVA
jgi:site-specific recombinase XerD